ncbi:Major Facilitator Superfamily protein [compost metagenome]
MYAPSFFSGWLLQRFGNPAMLASGIALSALAAVVALCSTALPAFYLALLCLGIGWNFMFVGGTTLLAGSYRTAERARTQAAAEFSAAVLTALATLAAGQVLYHWGWQAVNLAVLPALALALVITLRWQRHARRVGAMAAA